MCALAPYGCDSSVRLKSDAGVARLALRAHHERLNLPFALVVGAIGALPSVTRLC